MRNLWQVRIAKARFSELLDKTIAEGPQIVRRKDVQAAVGVPTGRTPSYAPVRVTRPICEPVGVPTLDPFRPESDPAGVRAVSPLLPAATPAAPQPEPSPANEGSTDGAECDISL